jgi:catechol 2,3-dioxygenase-like lactoylglutathione lyase family enzyme
MQFRLDGLDHVALSVSDVHRSIDWYHDVLSLERRFEEAWGTMPALVMAGSSGLALFPATPERPAGPGPGMLHLAFRVDRESFDAARRALDDPGIPVQFSDHDVAHSIYFADPDGYRLELTTYDV